MRLDHLLSRENARSAEALGETSKVEHPPQQREGCKEKKVERPMAERPKAEKPKDADWSRVEKTYRCIVLKDRIEREDLSTHLENCTGKSRGKTKSIQHLESRETECKHSDLCTFNGL